MNILKDFDEFKTFCSMRWDTTDGKGFYCHHTNGSCNEHACFLDELESSIESFTTNVLHSVCDSEHSIKQFIKYLRANRPPQERKL